MVKKVICLLIAAIFMAAMLSGCWDKVEIDERGFVGVIMVDMAPPGYEEKVAESLKDVPGVEGQVGRMIKVTYAFPLTVALAGEGGSGGKEPAFTKISSVATTMDKVNRYVDSRISRRLFFGFTQVIIFGEEFLQNPDKVKEVIDYFRRNPEFGRSMRVLAAEGEAADVAEITPEGEKLLSRYTRGVLENQSSSGRITDMTFNEFIVMMSDTGSGVMPRVTVKKDEIKVAGLALIKGYKKVGELTEFDTPYFNALNDRSKSGSMSINVDDITVNYVIRNSSRKMELVNSDPDKLEVSVIVKTEGVIPSGEADREIFDSSFLKEVETQLNKVENESFAYVVKKLQKEYGIDALMIGEFLRKYHPSLWSKLGGRWNEIYPNMKITPVADNRIRRIGTVK